jgi:hypothetical protein
MIQNASRVSFDRAALSDTDRSLLRRVHDRVDAASGHEFVALDETLPRTAAPTDRARDHGPDRRGLGSV